MKEEGEMEMMKRSGFAVVCVFLLAGSSSTVFAQSGTWTYRAAMPIPQGQATLSVISGRLYVAGGIVGSHRGNWLTVYDPTTDTWSIKTRSGVIYGAWWLGWRRRGMWFHRLRWRDKRGDMYSVGLGFFAIGRGY